MGSLLRTAATDAASEDGDGSQREDDAAGAAGLYGSLATAFSFSDSEDENDNDERDEAVGEEMEDAARRALASALY